MQVENLRDILDWTIDFHQQLSLCLADCANKNESERAKLLLDYLAQHEQRLTKVIMKFEKTASSNALNTWCYEYLDKHPIVKHKHTDAPFSDLNTLQITEIVIHMHQQVITLYRDLAAQTVVNSAHDLLEELLSLEEHEAMRMSQSANRLEDM
jgi:DNA integrity scanning protein DisA with diadenylate cyclase activity